MKLYTKMPEGLKTYFKVAVNQYRLEVRQGNLSGAWRNLERAHIVGQRWPAEHTYVHWEMLKFAFRIKSLQEIVGQLPRLLVGGIKSFVGKVPVGNTGGADVPPLKSMPIPEDLEKLMAGYLAEQR